MFAIERRKFLLECIRKAGSVRIVDMAKELNVTPETIRKDIKYLSECGLVEKQFGGATAISNVQEVSVDTRLEENANHKRRIAEKALEYLNGTVFYVDAGSTLATFAEAIVCDNDKTIVTNSFKAASALMDSCPNLLFLGGEVSTVTSATGGFWTSKILSSFNIDVAFLGTSGFESHVGPCTKTFSDAQTKSSVIKISQKKIVLADGSKFLTRAVFPYCNWSDIDVLITDKSAPEKELDKLSSLVEIVVI